MVIDTLANSDKYVCLHPSFQRAFEYIKSQNLESMEAGRYEIDGDELKGIVSDKPAMTQAESTAKFECHDKHIDIQFCISGNEQIGWKPRSNCHQQKRDYNIEKDVVFFNDAPDMYFKLTNNQFAIFFPEDVHAPMIGEGNIKKLVIKVKI